MILHDPINKSYNKKRKEYAKDHAVRDKGYTPREEGYGKKKSYDSNDVGPVDIEAVLSRKKYHLLITGKATLEIPEGVTMKNKEGSKLLYFDCENRDLATILCDGLDNSGIDWNEGV